MLQGLVLPGLLLSLGCEPPEAVKPAEPDANPNLPPARVDLPPIVPLEGTIPPETHADGTMRIDGLLARRDKHMGKKIMVRGYVVQKYECPMEAKRCEHPHAWLADSPAGGDKKLMLVRIDDRMSYSLAVGEQYTVTGKFERSDGGFVRSGGLLVQESIDGLEMPDDKAWAKIDKKIQKERMKARKAAEKNKK